MEVSSTAEAGYQPAGYTFWGHFEAALPIFLASPLPLASLEEAAAYEAARGHCTAKEYVWGG